VSKRLADLLISAVGLAVLSPLLLVVALAVKLTSRGPVFFRQERVGRGGRPFFILKYRTMIEDAPKRGGPITFGNDPRITGFGRL
jgi:lipopolysaccharide/colanic/teichoic acid biosynthesis glycosyltransferase